MLVEFCLPVRNEEDILAANAQRLYDYLEGLKPDYRWRIVIIVNGSDDSSASVAARLSAGNPRFLVKVLREGGKGRALKAYFDESEAGVLAFMDIDLAVSLEGLKELIPPALNGGHDLVIGSRLLRASRTDRSLWRSFTSHCYNALSRLVLSHRFSDLQCGFKAFRRELFTDLRSGLADDQWFFDTELVVLASRAGRRVKEIPVDWRENRYDRRESKIRVFRDVWPFIRNLFRLRRRLSGIRYPGNAETRPSLPPDQSR